MAKTKSKQPQTLPKAVSKAQKANPKSKEIEPAMEPVAKKVDEGSGSDSDEEDSDEDDIDEAGMKRIIDLLGDDGLDEFAQYQLGVLGGQGSEEEDDEIGSDEESPDVQEDSGSENEASDKPIGPSTEDEDIGDDEDEDIAVTQDAVDSEVSTWKVYPRLMRM
jgi:rRNA-processing protein EBP2